MDIVKIGILGMAGVLLAIPLKKGKSEYSLFISMAVCICIFVYIITKIQTVLDFAKKLESLITIDSSYIALVIKMVGIPMQRNLPSTYAGMRDTLRLQVRLRRSQKFPY